MIKQTFYKLLKQVFLNRPCLYQTCSADIINRHYSTSSRKIYLGPRYIMADASDAATTVPIELLKTQEETIALDEVDAKIAAEDNNVEMKEEKETKPDDKNNTYAYLKRDEFTSELYKIEVKGLPKFYGFKELKKLLNNKLKLNAHKIKANKGVGSGAGFMFVTFKTGLDRNRALDALSNYKWKNCILNAAIAKASEDPLARKRAHEKIDSPVAGFIKGENVWDAMKRVTIPWSDIPYLDQLKKKREAADIITCEMTKRILSANPSLKCETNKICPIENILASPITDEYRNKCEFTIGCHPETKEKMVGFRTSSYKDGSIAIGPVNHLIHLPKDMIKVAHAFQSFVRSSDIDVFDPETHSGGWKQLTVRLTSTGELMVIVLINGKESQVVDVEQFKKLKESLTQTFQDHSDPKISSFFVKLSESSGQKEKNIPELLFGNAYITETLSGLKFRISPEAFFQVNVKAAEVLYNTIGSVLESNPNTTLLDVCCGTGTIGISLANKCGQVLGIEVVESAVQDAKTNAELNGLSDKCQFFAGRAENIMDLVIGKAKFQNIVAIVDPPRSGLHQRVLMLLRKCEKIKYLIYVSCDARLAMKNFADLARPNSKAYKGAPFIPKKIIPVDLFPHCHQLELIILFERQYTVDL